MRVGLDVGGTKTDAVAVSPSGEIVGRVRLATGWGPDAVVATVLAAVAALSRDAGIAPGAISSIGVGIPGQVEPGSSRVLHAVNLGVDELDLAAAVEPQLGVPVRVENDVKAAALGADALRAAMPDGGSAPWRSSTSARASPRASSTGGELWRGARGTAGEVGHISIDPNGPLCRCGQRGCIEAFSGGAAIAERWGRPGSLPVRDVFDAADAGDAAAHRAPRGARARHRGRRCACSC